MAPDLHTLGFIERKENVILLGPPGVGKTHLAISLAVARAQSGRRLYYGTLADLITSLEDAQQAGHLQQRMKTLVFPSLLVVDEIGYLPVSRTGAMLFFQLMAKRYEHASTVLTSNKSFAEWGAIFGDEVMAAALIDRLVHQCHIVNTRGNSYRMGYHQDLGRALGAPRHPPARSPPSALLDPTHRRRISPRPTARTLTPQCAILSRRKCAISTAVDNVVELSLVTFRTEKSFEPTTARRVLISACASLAGGTWSSRASIPIEPICAAGG